MKTKRLLALLSAGALSVSMLAGCGSTAKTDDTASDSAAADTSASADSDLEYVKSQGKLVVGITDFAPMDYKEDGSDEWIGFDADMAKAFAESIGVEAEFLEINWDNKIMELDGKGVDFYDASGEEAPADREARLWIDAVINDKTPVVTPEQAYCVSRILNGIYESAKTGEPYYFD